jgi:hypothetical protein
VSRRPLSLRPLSLPVKDTEKRIDDTNQLRMGNKREIKERKTKEKHNKQRFMAVVSTKGSVLMWQE